MMERVPRLPCLAAVLLVVLAGQVGCCSSAAGHAVSAASVPSKLAWVTTHHARLVSSSYCMALSSRKSHVQGYWQKVPAESCLQTPSMHLHMDTVHHQGA
jgi:hypothetical protein